MTTKIEEIMAKVLDEVYGESALHPEVVKGQIDALDDAGLAVLPKAPTDKMMLMGGFSFAGSCPNDEVFPKTRKIWDKMTAAFDPQIWKPSE